MFKGLRIRWPKRKPKPLEMIDVGRVTVRVTFDTGEFDFVCSGYTLGHMLGNPVWVDASSAADDFIGSKKPIDMGTATDAKGYMGISYPRHRVVVYHKGLRESYAVECEK